MLNRTATWRDWFTFSRTANRFSLEELERLYYELVKQTRAHKTRRNFRPEFSSQRSPPGGNKETFVETLRSIAELMIWGDQHEPRFFEFFLEKNILFEFYEILASSVNRRGEIATQVLQTLSIMISNMKKETSVFYLFSNNHLNNILQLDFDFSDEEVLAFYISFLKSISLKLNPKTIHFFFNKSSDGVGASFPLYTEAIRFVGNKEAMVRAAVRTLTLNIYSVDDEDVQAFVVSKPASNYFTELALYAAEQCQLLDRLLLEAENTLDDSYGSLDSQIDRIEDMLSYFNDIFLTGSEVLKSKLASCLWEYFISPALFWPLLEVGSRSASETSIYKPFISANGVTGGGVFRAVTSLCVIERIIHVMESPILPEAIACCLLAGDRCDSDICEKTTNCQSDLRPTTPFHMLTASAVHGTSETTTSIASPPSTLPESPIRISSASSVRDLFVKYRSTFLRCLSGDSTQIGTAAVRVLLALVSHTELEPDVLEVCGVLPARTRIRQTLLHELAGPEELDDPSTSERGMTNNAELTDKDSLTGSQRPSRAKQFIRGLSTQSHHQARAEASCTDQDEVKEVRFEQTEDLLSALCHLTLLPTLPPLTICHITWIISQLTVPRDSKAHKESPKVTGSCLESVSTALMVSQTSIGEEMRGIWSDGLLSLIHQQWMFMRNQSTEPRLILSSSSLLDSVFSQKASELGSGIYDNHASVTSQQLAVRLRLSCSAQCALHILYKLQRFISLLQLKQCILHGHIDDTSGLPIVTKNDLVANELKEECDIELHEISTIPCTISFAPGQDQRVYYAFHGVYQPGGSNSAAASDYDLLHALPTVVLVAPSLTRIRIGCMISVAPIIGSNPRIDERHENWLHIHIRSSIVLLLNICEKCMRNNQPPWVQFREMREGHWILAFQTNGEAMSAQYSTQESIAKMAALYCDILSPLLSTETIECEKNQSMPSTGNLF